MRYRMWSPRTDRAGAEEARCGSTARTQSARMPSSCEMHELAYRLSLAVVGSMIAATGVIRFAGKPDFCACSRINDSLAAL